MNPYAIQIDNLTVRYPIETSFTGGVDQDNIVCDERPDFIATWSLFPENGFVATRGSIRSRPGGTAVAMDEDETIVGTFSGPQAELHAFHALLTRSHK